MDDKFIQGRKGENLACKRYCIEFITDLDSQYDDKDACDENGYTYSIKDQLETSAEYHTITAEYKLGSTKSSTLSMDGNLLANKTDFYLWLVTHQEKAGFLMMSSPDFKQFVLENSKRWVVRELRPETVRANSRQGRLYNLSWSYAVPVEELVAQEWCLFDEISPEYLSKHYK